MSFFKLAKNKIALKKKNAKKFTENFKKNSNSIPLAVLYQELLSTYRHEFLQIPCIKYIKKWFLLSTYRHVKMNFLKMFVTIHGAVMLKSNFRCFGSQIEISIMKNVSKHQCKRFLIYDHDDLSDLHIEINFLKKSFLAAFWAPNSLINYA